MTGSLTRWSRSRAGSSIGTDGGRYRFDAGDLYDLECDYLLVRNRVEFLGVADGRAAEIELVTRAA